MADEDALRLYWERFFKAETGTYEKSTWLDLFLAEFLIRLNDGANPKELISFCPISGVVSLVGCELLCGIHRVTSSVSSLAAPAPSRDNCSARPPLTDSAGDKDGEKELSSHGVSSLFSLALAQPSSETLRQYLLRGLAWRCLALLRALGVEGLSCCRQLSSVLIWLYGELGAAGAGAASPPAPRAPRTPIHQLFSHRIWSKQKMCGSQSQTPKNSNTLSEKSPAAGRSRLGQSKSDDSKPKRKQMKHSDHSSESGDSNQDLQILNKSLTIKLSTPNDDFEYFDSPIRSNNEFPNELYGDPFYVPKKPKPKADDFINEKHKQIFNSEISTFEFTLLITDLLQELCRTESSLSGSEGSQISMQCINFSLRNLCSLQFGSTAAQDNDEVSRIKVALTELLIVSLDKVLLHSDLCAKLINNGILPMLLRILEDVICKNSPKYQSKEDQNRAKVEKLNKTESDNLLKFVFGIAYSITAFFHCLLMQCRSTDKLREFTDQFKLYGECLKGGLLKDCIELMIRIPAEEEEVIILIKKLIESVGKLIVGMKRVRSEVVHSAACPRTRHKVCRQRVTAGMHHHHDILGEAGTGLPLSSSCCISVLYGTLTSLVTDEEVAVQSVLRSKILKVMLNCGVCCCFSPGFLMESIVRLMLTHNSVATLCLHVLEHTVYGELGASVLLPKVTDQLPCSVCEPSDDKRDSVRKYCPHGVNSVDRKSVWAFLIHYNSLLQLDNHNNVLHDTVSHILRVTPKCRVEMKHELLFSVIYPTFIVAKHRYIIRMEDSAYFLTVACLNIFSSLLNTVSFAEQFIQKGGLSYVLELVSLSEFSNQCCSILEIAIIVEIFKLMKENDEMSYFREISSLASVQMLFKSLLEMTDKCFKIYKLKLPIEKYEELNDISKERDSLSFTPVRPNEVRKSSISIKSFASENTEESIEEIEVLKNVCTFWKSCSNLCLYSPMFREYVISESVFVDSYALLKILLYCVCNCECSVNELRLLVKILEALLTVQFAVADVTSGRSKDTSCTVVRAALESGGAALQQGGALRALCEALIRVAVAQPSPRHAMPRAATPKVPPLGCPSGSSSNECSSSEDSAPGPYASEYSEPNIRPDDGYEADVEIGKLELLSISKSRKLSGSLSLIGTMGFQFPTVESMGEECAEYSKSGDLAHPELCIIVVDILTQLVHKLLSSPEPGPQQASMQRVGAGLARACCARLAGALVGARAPPPALLRRLLAPAAAQLLSKTHHQLQDLQLSILELIHVLASQSIEPTELAAFLKLFIAEDPPLSLLLGALQRLAEASTPHTPHCILTFPVDTDTDIELQEEQSYVTVSSASSQSQQAENWARNLLEAHTRLGFVSPWSRGALRCGFEGVGWAPWLHGFALLLWLRTHGPPPAADDDWDAVDDWQPESPDSEPAKSPTKKEPTRTVELSHVVSVGHDSLMFEVWLDTASGCFTFRLARPDVNSNKIVSEARAETALPPQRWSCVALNVRETVHKRRIYIQVTIYINGLECETASLPVQGILVRKVMPSTMVVGAAGRSAQAQCGAYHLASVSLYRAPVIGRYAAVHAAAHGPDNACQVQCDTPNFPLILTPNLLDANLDWDQVFEISSATLREMHDNLLLTFSAHAPTIMNLYHQTVAMPTVFSGRVPAAGLMSSGAGAGAGAPIPETLFPAWAGAPLPSRHRGLPLAVHMLGGPEVLLYLFARVVELDGTYEEQATALAIVLRVCRADNRLYAHLYRDDTLDMLLTVLASPKCKLSYHLLKVILDEACSSPVLVAGAAGPVVLARSDAALLEPRLLPLLVRAARQLDGPQELTWEVETQAGVRQTHRGSLWALTLRCIRVLVRGGGEGEGEHPRRAFNHYQLTRAGMLRHLLTACKERFLNSECGPLQPSASNCLVELVRGLMGAPPLLDRLALLCDFLLLMHQASDTFVTHSRANFYFLLTSETQEMSEFHSKKRSTRRSKRSSHTDDLPSSSSVTSEDVNENSLNVREKETDNRLDQSGESTKQLKSIINAQIKEGKSRKHNVSSTSENSDVTIERSDAAESGDRDAITKKRDSSVTKRHSSVSKGDSSVLKENSSVIKGDSSVLRDALADSEGAGDEEGEGKKPELNEYIVVDVDDVQHTTVEMYSSGIYQQQRVRAGAEPGWTACEGLLLLLRDTVNVLPDHALVQAVCGAIQAESLVVLGNHKSAAVRAALVRVIAALQRRATPELNKKLKALNYYVHLANQISLYESSWELASACAALLTKCDVPLEDQLDEEIWMEMCEEWTARSPPLLATLPGCLSDVPLAHNVSLILRRVIDKASLKALSEISVVEVVVRSIRAVGLMEDAFEGRELLLEDLFELLNRVAIKALSSQHSMQTISEIHHMLSYLELSGPEPVSNVARSAQLALYIAQLDHLEDRLHRSYSAHTEYANYFTTVLSSAVSLGLEGISRAERTELASRHLATVTRAVAFLTSQSVRRDASMFAPLLDRLLATLLPAVSGAGNQRGKWWVAAGAEWAGPLQELWSWAAAPAAGVRPLAPRLLRALYAAPAARAVLTPHDPTSMRKLAVYLLTILKYIHLEAEEGSPSVELPITDWARSWALATQAGLAERLPGDTLAAEAERLLQIDEEKWAKAAAKQRASVAKVVFSKDALASKLTETAMGITRQVVDIQNAERKAFMEHLRRAHSDAVAAQQRWQRAVDHLTHEQAVWHCARGYPAAWQLDATEGPGRVRVRLRRGHLDIQPRFLKPHARHKAETAHRGPPLRSVVGTCCGVRGGLVARLQLNETVTYMARVTYVTVASETRGELLLSDRCIHFVPEDIEDEPPPPPSNDKKEKRPEQRSAAQSWPLEAVVQVATRRWCLQERAAELFLSSGHAHLLAFADVTERTAFLKALGTCHLPSRIEADTLQEAMTQWRNGQITNWEYLMRLNGLGGRSYNDLMQYPVLPFVIADYSSRILDLNDPASFRDLTRPMAIQNKNREQHYINTYNDLKAARREGCSPLLSRQPHHYPSLYSNSGGVLHYLVRLPPFTELFLNYQDNNFDMPDRTFHSLATTWRLITNDSPTDVKELIPELFYLPELFHNNEGLNLGVRQCGASVDDVELPPWAADSRIFTLIHRQALEAPHVTENLPHWIDLVFGYKQTGQAAIDAINVFPACTYYGFDPCALEDEVDRRAAAAMVRTYGQAPRQLLRAPHPHRPPDLIAHIGPQAQPAVWAGVEGACWGRYAGAPGLGAAGCAARRTLAGAAALLPLPAPHGRSVAVQPRNTLLVPRPGDASSSATQSSLPSPPAQLSWGHSDNIVRLKRRRDARPELLLYTPPLDQVTKVSTSWSFSGCPIPIFIGHMSGRVLALRLPAPGLRPRPRPLLAHTAPVTDICVCARAGLLATASADGYIVLWDLNDLSYIRTLPNRGLLSVTHVTISETLCDVATVHDAASRHDATTRDGAADGLDFDSDSYEKDATYKYKSLIRVHTVNARFVGSVKVSEAVTCICYSGAAEGISVNCVAAGLRSGAVRLYSSWDLRHVATVAPHHAQPLLSLTYSSDSQLLFGCYADGVCVAWESGARARPAPVRILPAHALF